MCKQSSAHWSLDCLERTVNQSYCLADRGELLPLTEDSTPCSNGNVCASSSRSRSARFKKSHDVFVHSKIVPVLSQGHPSHRLVTMGLWVAELCVHSAPGRRGARGVPISAPGKVVFLESRRGTTRSSHDSLRILCNDNGVCHGESPHHVRKGCPRTPCQTAALLVTIQWQAGHGTGGILSIQGGCILGCL